MYTCRHACTHAVYVCMRVVCTYVCIHACTTYRRRQSVPGKVRPPLRSSLKWWCSSQILWFSSLQNFWLSNCLAFLSNFRVPLILLCPASLKLLMLAASCQERQDVLTVLRSSCSARPGYFEQTKLAPTETIRALGHFRRHWD